MEKTKRRKFLIAFDMDGTLLRRDNTVGEKSREIIKKLVSMGHYVTVASGRPVRIITDFYKKLGLNGPVISYNGAMVSDPSDPSFETVTKTFSKNTIVDFLNNVGYEKIDNVMIECGNDLISKKKDEDLRGFYHSEGMLEKIGDVRKLISGDSLICIIKMRTSDLDERLVKAAFYNPGIGIRFWGGVGNLFSELYWLDVNKAYGIEIARRKLGLEKDDVIVIGDEDNDMEMISYYTNTIAMINGNPLVKERASTISEFDNNSDGAALAVLKMVEKLSQ